MIDARRSIQPSWSRLRPRAAVTALLVAFLVGGLEAVLGAPRAVQRHVPVLCYVETLFGDVTPEQIDFRFCTHVIEAFLLVDPSGAMV